ncbi:MAG: phosphomannomutase, partial [Candidatus Hydrothermota bacterium]
NVIRIGTVPTPLLYFSLFHLPVDGGIQVTASHNPREYNGFKINLGRDVVWGEGIQRIREIIEKEAFLKTFERGKLETQPVTGAYIDRIVRDVKIQKDIRVAVDAGNGTAGPVIQELYHELGVKYKGLYLDPDGTFPNHLPDPTVEKYMEDLKKLVVDGKFNLGVGFDGDSDRIGAIDEKGQIIFGDKLLGVFAKAVLKEFPGSTIIFDVKCSKGLVEYIKKLGGKPLMWKTGHSLLKAKLKETNAPLAGEMSGHIFFNDRYFGYDDAIYASVRLFEILSKTSKPLSALVAEIPSYISTPEIRVGCPDERKFDVVADLVQYFKSKNLNVIDIDGARIEFDDGFGLVRASNTQPVLVLRFEAKTEERLQEIKDIIISKLREYPEVDLSEIE